jgi:hypothetical protein
LEEQARLHSAEIDRFLAAQEAESRAWGARVDRLVAKLGEERGGHLRAVRRLVSGASIDAGTDPLDPNDPNSAGGGAGQQHPAAIDSLLVQERLRERTAALENFATSAFNDTPEHDDDPQPSPAVELLQSELTKRVSTR